VPTRSTQSKPSPTTSTRRSVQLSSTSMCGCSRINSGNRGITCDARCAVHVDAQASAQRLRRVLKHRFQFVHVGQHRSCNAHRNADRPGSSAPCASFDAAVAYLIAPPTAARPWIRWPWAALRLSAALVKLAISATRTKICMASIYSWRSAPRTFAIDCSDFTNTYLMMTSIYAIRTDQYADRVDFTSFPGDTP
jgi:hypothetical protein